MPSESVDGMDPEAVYNAVMRASEHIRSGKGPYYLEIRTYRFKGHSVSDPGKYRSKEEVAEYKGKDPVKMVEAKLLDGMVSEDEIKEIKAMIKKEIDEAVAFAEAGEYPDPSELYTDNYVQKDYPF